MRQPTLATLGLGGVLDIFRRGQVLIRRGDTVSHAEGTTLRQINDERSDITKYSTLAGITLLMALMVAGWGKILRRFGGVSGWPRELSMVYLLMILFVALNRLGVFVATSMAVNSAAIWWSADAYLWGLPYAAGPITVFVLLGMQPAVLFAVFTGLTAGILLRGDFEVVVFALAAGLVGCFGSLCGRLFYRRRTGQDAQWRKVNRRYSGW